MVSAFRNFLTVPLHKIYRKGWKTTILGHFTAKKTYKY